MTDRLFIEFSVRKLEQLYTRIEACTGRLSAGQVWARGGDNQNAIGNLLLHLAGNARQWIVSGVGGQPDVRARDFEFGASGDIAPHELLGHLKQTLQEVNAVLSGVTAERLAERITVQKYDVSVLEAIFHVVEHFAMHTGQIIFATKMLTGEELGFYRHLAGPAHDEKTP